MIHIICTRTVLYLCCIIGIIEYEVNRVWYSVLSNDVTPSPLFFFFQTSTHSNRKEKKNSPLATRTPSGIYNPPPSPFVLEQISVFATKFLPTHDIIIKVQFTISMLLLHHHPPYTYHYDYTIQGMFTSFTSSPFLGSHLTLCLCHGCIRSL